MDSANKLGRGCEAYRLSTRSFFTGKREAGCSGQGKDSRNVCWRGGSRDLHMKAKPCYPDRCCAVWPRRRSLSRRCVLIGRQLSAFYSVAPCPRAASSSSFRRISFLLPRTGSGASPGVRCSMFRRSFDNFGVVV